MILALEQRRVGRLALHGEDVAKICGDDGVVEHARVGIQETPVAALAQVPQLLDVERRVGAVHEFEGRTGRDGPIEGSYADAGIAMRVQMDEDAFVAGRGYDVLEMSPLLRLSERRRAAQI